MNKNLIRTILSVITLVLVIIALTLTVRENYHDALIYQSIAFAVLIVESSSPFLKKNH